MSAPPNITAAPAAVVLELAENSRIVRPQYLEQATHKKDLLRRLRNVVTVLSSDPIEPESPEWPGLLALAHALAPYWHSNTNNTNKSAPYSSDADVRLYTVLAGIEILTIYAPDVPWDEPQVLDLFQQMTRQLGNLATKSSSSSEESSRSSNPFLQHYLHMLRQLAEVKIGCILVDLVNNQIENQVDPTNSESEEDDDDDQEDSDGEIKGKKRSKPNTLGKARRRTTALRAPPTRDSALDILVEFLTTLMHGVRREHPSEVLSLVEGAISSTLSDYHPGIQVPIPVLDVLLRCIGQGPTQSIVVQKQQFAKHTSASKRAAAAAAVQQVQVANPTYQVAAKVIQTMLNKIAEPISQLLNGLLNGDPHYVDQSSIRCIIASDFTEPEPSPPLANNKRKTKGSRLVPFDLDSDDNEVFHIVYELHRVAPQILTTVLGTVGRGLSSTLAKQRYQTVLLMGRLFSSEYANLAHEYAASFRDWLGRKNDMESRIRVCMVQQCMAVLSRHCATDTPGADSFKRTKTLSSPLTNAASADPEIAMAVADALRVLVTLDLSLDVRLEGIHLLCDWAYKENCASSAISASILQTVGSRVSAKHKQERKDAVTGLAHVFYRHGLQSQLQAVTSGGDDCDPSLVAQTIHEMCPFLVDSAATKSDLRKRHRKDDHDPYRWIPIKVLECACFTDAVDTEMRSRVIYIVDDLLLTGGSPKKMSPTCRALAWTTLVDTMTGNDGILSLLNSSSTSHKRINAFKHLQRLLRTRAVLQQKVSMYIDTRLKIGESASGSEDAIEAEVSAMELLESIAKLSAPLDGAKLSLESVLKSFHAARDKHIFRILSTIASCDHTMQARTRALQELPDRTKSLGDGVAEWVKNLVKRCAMGESLNASVTNQCVLLAKDCVSEGDIPACAALLAAVKFAVDIFPALCSSENIFENLTELFTTCRSVTGATKKELQALGIVTALSSILSTVAVVPTSKDLPGNGLHENDMKQQLTQLCLRDGTPEQTRNAVHALARFVCPSGQSEIPATDEDFVSLLQLLTSASRLKIPTDKRESMKVVCALSALSALASSAPLVLTSSTRGDKAFKFALESILIGRENANADQGPDSDDDEASIEGSPASPSLKGGRHSSASKRKNLTPEVKPSLLEDEHLSLSCRTICASVDFLVSHVRSVSLLRASVGLSVSLSNTILSPSNEQIQRLFQLLTQILDDQGLPPSAKDSRSCMSRQDRAALRQTAGVGLIRLCDIRLGLEKEMLTPAMWISLGNTFLDEELSVRDVVLEEYSTFLKCTGIYGIERSNHLSKVPSLRFLSYVVLCNEGDCKSAAKICVSNLRITTEANYRKQCALGKEAEQKFEAYQKMLTMPEYCVPFAYYLLSHRKDTPSDGAVNQTVDSSDNEDDSMRPDYEAQHRMLRKRLKHLFDPLVNSLGDGADNISFLLRMTEIIGKRYTPLDPFLSCSNRRSIGSNGGIVDQPSAPNKRKSTQLDGRLKAICSVASEVLSSYVKIDKNLSTFFGSIHVPKSVFETKPIKRGGIVSTCIPVENSASHSTSRRSVTFSPEVSFRNGKIAEQLTPQLNHPQREPSSQSAARPAALLRSFPPSPNPVLNSRAVDRSTSFQSPGQQNENAKNDLSLKSSSGASTVTLSQNPSIEASSSKTLPECSEESSQPFSSHNEQPLKRRSRLSSSSKSDRRVVKKKSKAKPDALPKQINVVKIKARKHLDDLDFDFRDSENKPVSRNASNHQELKTTRSTRRQK